MKHLFRHNCLVQKLATAQLVTGTFDPTYSTRLASVDCLLQHKVLRNFDQFGKLTVRKIVKMFCDYTTTSDELITNGGFDSVSTPWQIDTIRWQYLSLQPDGDYIQYEDEIGSQSSTAYQDNLGLTAGKTYQVQYKVVSVNMATINGMTIKLGGTEQTNCYGSGSGLAGNYTKTIVAGSDDDKIQFVCTNTALNDIIAIDNVSVIFIGTSSIIESDRVVVASGNFAGTYEVIGITDAGGQAHHLELMLELVD